MSKGAQCRKAACQNAGVRVDQGAVEVKKNGAGHDHGLLDIGLSDRCETPFLLCMGLFSHFFVRSSDAPTTAVRASARGAGGRTAPSPKRGRVDRCLRTP